MPSLISCLRPFRYDRVSRIAVVETGPGRLVSGVLAELRRLFPDATVELLLREEDAALASSLEADVVRVVRFEERAALVRELRTRRFDVVAMQLSRSGAQGLRSLPFVLRGGALLAFNDSLDHFPLNVFRLRDLAAHFGLSTHGANVVLAPLLFAYLLASTTWIRVRGGWRRLRRPRGVRAPASAARAAPGESELDAARAAAGSESAGWRA